MSTTLLGFAAVKGQTTTILSWFLALSTRPGWTTLYSTRYSRNISITATPPLGDTYHHPPDDPFTTEQRDWDDNPLPLCEVGNVDFLGGDLPGIVAKLGYLRELGVNTLYLNPIFDSASNHKYNMRDFDNVAPSFGGNNALIALRRSSNALAHGGFQFLLAEGDLMAYQHTAEAETLIFIGYRGNGSDTPMSIPVHHGGVADGTALTDVIGGKTYTVADGLLAIGFLSQPTALAITTNHD